MATDVPILDDHSVEELDSPDSTAPLVSRRRWLGVTGLAAAVGAAGTLAASSSAQARGRGRDCTSQAPRPIPGMDPDLLSLGVSEHLFLPVPGREPSTIFDFSGRVAIMDLIGDGIRKVHGVEEPAAFRADLRFFDGVYVGLDGKRHHNTYHFI